MNARPALAVSALVAAMGLSLTGCAVYEELVHRQSTATFDDLAAFRAEADVDAPWLPTGATDITVRTSPPEKSDDVAPDPYAAKTVFVCGD